MKKKILGLGILVVVLIAALLVMFAVPMMTSVDADIGVAGEGIAAETADLAIVNSEANLVIESYAVADSGNTEQTVLWISLSASFLILVVAFTRRLTKLYNFIVSNLRSTLSGASANSEVMAGGPNRCIQPVAA